MQKRAIIYTVLLGIAEEPSPFFFLRSVAIALTATPSPVPIISPMPRLLRNASASAIEQKRPVESPIGVSMKYPRTAPPNHMSASTGPMMAPIPSAIGETQRERAGKREDPL